jgi:predicted RNA methylase
MMTALNDRPNGLPTAMTHGFTGGMSLEHLREKIAQTGWIPGKRDIPVVFAYWRALTDAEQSVLEKRLSKIDPPCAKRAALLFRQLDERSRGDLCRPILKAMMNFFVVVSDPELFGLECLRDESPRVRKAAAQAIGASWSIVPTQFRSVFVDAMIANLRISAEQSERKALTEALGKSGLTVALNALEALAGQQIHPSLKSTLSAALLTARRDVSRSDSETDDCAPNKLGGVGLCVFFTPGIEAVARMRAPFSAGDILEPGVLFVRDVIWGDIAKHLLWREATIVLGHWDQQSAESLARMISRYKQGIDAATSRDQGPVRLRLGRDEGRSRGFLWDFAAALERIDGDLMSDGRGAHWEVRTKGPLVMLLPLKYEDKRFDWRNKDVDGASDPTVASALVQLACVKPSERVYDPFCGAATEMILAAKAEPSATIVGSELVSEIARAGLDAAASANVKLVIHKADALTFDDGPFDVILTNPPFGMRTVRGGARELLAEFFADARRRLTENGRVVVLSHAPGSTRQWAAAGQLYLRRSFPIRLGAMGCEIQVFTKNP